MQLLALDDEELEPIVEHWYVPSRRMRFVRRNALVAVGNTCGESALPLLSQYLNHDDPLLRGHAAWAVGQIGGSEGAEILAAVSEGETDESVQEELALGIVACDRSDVYADVVSIRSHDSEEDPK